MVLSLHVALRNAVFWRVRGIRPVGDMWPTPSITTTALAQPASPHFYPRVSRCYAVLLRLIFYFAGSRELLLRQFGGTPVFPALLS